MSEEAEKVIIEEFGDREVQEYAHTKIPKFLWGVYILLPLWGAFWWMSYWNGSNGVLDRGYWSELEEAANTKFVVEEKGNRPLSVSE